MAEPLALYRRLVGARIRSQLQYRVSFALELTAMFLVSFLDFAMVLVIFHNIPALGGWSVEEVAFLYAVSTLSFALADLVIGHLENLPRLIRDGNFDTVLIRPRGALFQVLALDFQLRRLGRALQGVAVLAFALTALDIEWTPGRALMLPVMILAGVLIFCAVWVITMSIVFWAIEGRETSNAFTDGGHFFAQYPINIYEEWVRRFLAYVMPMAFVAYFPALYVLDKPDPLGLPEALRYLSPVVAALAAVVAAVVWRWAVRHYRSAGG